jgi:hypothetical protein
MIEPECIGHPLIAIEPTAFAKPIEMSRPLNAPTVHKERYDSPDKEHDEQNLCDAGSADRDSTEAKDGCNQGDDEKHYGVMKHFRIPRLIGGTHD